MSKFRLVAPFMIVMLVLTACPAGDGGDDGSEAPGGSGGAGGSIEVTSLWGGAEGEAFQAVLDAFEAESGVTVEYTTVRQDYSTVLNNRIEQGDPPDVAIIPGVGFLRSFAADDLIIPLADLGIDDATLESAYAPNLADRQAGLSKVLCVCALEERVVDPEIRERNQQVVRGEASEEADAGDDRHVGRIALLHAVVEDRAVVLANCRVLHREARLFLKCIEYGLERFTLGPAPQGCDLDAAARRAAPSRSVSSVVPAVSGRARGQHQHDDHEWCYQSKLGHPIPPPDS